MSSKETRESIEVTIHALGGMGDGLATHEGKTLYVPYSCAGDKLRVIPSQPKAKIVEVLEASAHRQAPECQHFGKCGGCSVQHLDEPTYDAFKQDSLRKILRQIGGNESVLMPMMKVGAQSRRRVEFKVRVNKKAVEIGFYAAKSHELIALKECPVSEPAVMDILPALREVLQGLSKSAQVKAVSVTALDAGLDMMLMVSHRLNGEDRQRLIEFAKANGILRLSEKLNETTTLYDSGKALVQFGGVDITLPVGAFLQATKAGEQAITSLVTEHLAGCEKVVDLYSGCGTYSFPLLSTAQTVTAFEGADAMVAAMHNAVVKQSLESRMKVSTRDLFKRPLKAKELKFYDGVVINPPRNGALPQVQHIAQSDINKLAMVSCNPASFKRDAAHLLEAGYRLTKLVPIDQFYWSSHLELVAHFEK